MAETDPLIGATLGGVRLESPLGSGGMGSVYLGQQTALGRNVAVKILPEHLSRDAEYISRFRQEAVTAGQLEHPNIVSIYDIGHTDGRYFIVMQFVEGESLQSVLDVMGTLHPRDAARVTIGILQGLHHAHAAGIVHRDIKPDNILITGNNQPKILDFGLATAADGKVRITASNTVVGTPYFLSPEQARGKPAEPRSDIYSAGITLYYLLTGRVPFRGNSPLAILNMHIHDTPVSPLNLNPKIPPALNDIVLKMIAKRPEDRYLTAEAAARDLQAFLDGRPVSVLRVRKTARSGAPWVRRGLTAGALAGAAGFLAYAFTQLPTEAPSGTPPPPPGANRVADPELDRVRELILQQHDLATKQGPRDHAVYLQCLTELDKLGMRYHSIAGAADLIAMGRRHVQDAAETVAREAERELRPRLDTARREGDAFTVRDLLLGFPRALLEITPTGKAIAREIDQHNSAVQDQIVRDLRTIEERIAADEFEGARVLLDRLHDKGPAELADRLRNLRDKADDREAERRVQILPRLINEVNELQAHASELLRRGRSDEAWGALIGILEKYPAHKVSGLVLKIGRIPFTTLKEFEPSRALEEELDTFLRRLEAEAPARIEDLPSHRLRMLLEDVLRLEWIRRAADRGLQRLATAGEVVALELLAGRTARLQSGTPPVAQSEQGTIPLRTADLPPRDLAFFAAASRIGPAQPLETAFGAVQHRRLSLAVGIAYLYSLAPDRNLIALRWMEQARGQGHPVPPFRVDDLEAEVALEKDRILKEFLSPAHEHAAARRYKEAHVALDQIERDHRGRDVFPTLQPLLVEHRIRFLLEEGQQARQEKNWRRVREIVARLRKDHPAHDRAASDALLQAAALASGTWKPLALKTPSATDKMWLWEGKAQAARAPARIDAGGLTFTEAGGFRPLFLELARTEGVTGVRARLRVNQMASSFELGFLVDARSLTGEQRRILVRSTGHVEVKSRRGDRWENLAEKELPLKPRPKETYELAVVADGGDLHIFFGPSGALQAVATIEGGLDGEAMVGFWTGQDASFSEIQLRDVK